MLRSFSRRSVRKDLTPDQRWEAMPTLFVGGLFQLEYEILCFTCTAIRLIFERYQIHN